MRSAPITGKYLNVQLEADASISVAVYDSASGKIIPYLQIDALNPSGPAYEAHVGRSILKALGYSPPSEPSP